MKKLLRIPLLLAVLFLTTLPLSAHDFEVDGIYYNILDETAKTVAVTYSGYHHDSVENEYTGDVSIPNSVTYSETSYSVTFIETRAFWNCTGLTSITIPNSVTSIGYYAFWGCTGLTSVTIPNSVTTIEGSAFSGCTGLTSITIPNSVTTIGSGAFSGCTGLTGVHISSIESWLMINMGVFPFYNCECKLILNGTEVTNLTIPTSISQIKSYAFAHCTGLTSITIPNSVTSIGESAFWGCTGLTSVTIGESISEIADYTFNKCDSIKSINFNAINCLSIGKNALPNTTAITYLGIGENVTKIPDFNFKSTIKTLNYDAINCLSGNFYGYTGLATVSIGENVTTIQPNTFSGCTGLTTVNYNALNCTSMGDSDNPVFKDCKITTLNIGGKVTAIPTYAFYRCSSLKTVNISDLSAWCKIDFEEAYIGRYRFISNPLFYAGKLYLNGTEITKLEIPNDVPEIKNYTFYDCYSLTSVTIPNSVTSIGEYAFYNCSGLTSATIGDSVTKIADHAFENCNNLTSITIPRSATSIGSDAFYYCYKLVKLNFSTSHTTFSLSSLTTPTKYSPYCYNYYNQKYMNAGDKITGLAPSTSFSVDYGLIINGTYCRTYYSSISTNSFSVNLKGNATVTTLSATGSHSNGDVTILGEGINIGSDITSYNGESSLALTGLDPNTTYTVYYGVKIKESSSAYTTSKTFTTGALEWSAGEYQATSTTSVRLMTETTCDATAGTGIEWRRYGAPESLAPNKAECPVVDGMLVGYLKGLNPEAYYEYRPYYTSASGKTYYGEWAAFFSGDAGVYFEPEVRTFTENSVDGNSVTIKGYALPGTDEVTGQGFEYWKTSGISTYSTDNVKTVSASGISMSVTLSNLDYNSTYCYRAFVTTAKGTTYGDTVEFSTGYPAGIYTVEADKDENTASYRIMPGMLVVNGEGETPVMVADMNGRVLFNGYAAGQLELPLKAGIYILRLGNNAHKVAIR